MKRKRTVLFPIPMPGYFSFAGDDYMYSVYTPDCGTTYPVVSYTIGNTLLLLPWSSLTKTLVNMQRQAYHIRSRVNRQLR
ncbi:hypothetical protein F5Y09DRAFT_315835 [Xylaria sp. FL1042]|nr:hypothetical protein F5Y09DRAFT_315835 [Xylaria sp. FL1042]